MRHDALRFDDGGDKKLFVDINSTAGSVYNLQTFASFVNIAERKAGTEPPHFITGAKTMISIRSDLPLICA